VKHRNGSNFEKANATRLHNHRLQRLGAYALSILKVYARDIETEDDDQRRAALYISGLTAVYAAARELGLDTEGEEARRG